MAEIQTMYADGVLGNQGIINVLGVLVGGVFNYIRPKGAAPYELKNTIGSVFDYMYPPETPEQQKNTVNNNLLAFLSQAPGFNKDLLGVNHGK